ncbi:hypothetical protein G7Z17_g2459 [Cylindrodendrum hubeiense]|uniref:SnoaL-like domain-containing protein n=1 Tax=Cylindrodendrum hubeiense TaxID=595255 RepID=A0A9P5HJS7_9HYPO|nr:hypothetical protein G7Z17_g2459 [Cylindrodendrum hubeiense]
MASDTQSDLFDHLRDLYAKYRQTKELEGKGLFYAEECRQICRPDPSYAARNGATIVRYLAEAGELVGRILREAGQLEDGAAVGSNTKGSYYTIRPVTADEADDFGTAEHVNPAGFSSVSEVRSKAKAENWVGIKVDMWMDDGDGKGLLVKAKYWFRLENQENEGGDWKQILHDILFLGVRDGTEGSDGVLIKEF